MVQFDKYYKLNPNNYYWCIQLQQEIKFKDTVVVKATQRTALDVSDKGRLWFGKIVVRLFTGIDELTETEIGFMEDDVVGKYEFQSQPPLMPFHYMDYLYGWSDKSNNKQQ
jgi:hypothetical protein